MQKSPKPAKRLIPAESKIEDMLRKQLRKKGISTKVEHPKKNRRDITPKQSNALQKVLAEGTRPLLNKRFAQILESVNKKYPQLSPEKREKIALLNFAHQIFKNS